MKLVYHLLPATIAGAIAGLIVAVASSRAPKPAGGASPGRLDDAAQPQLATTVLKYVVVPAPSASATAAPRDNGRDEEPTRADHPVSPEAEQQASAEADRRAHDQRLASHRREARDPKWAPATESRISRALDEAAQKLPMQVDSVECRTSTCVAQLSWASAAEAHAQMFDLVKDTGPGIECERRLTLPEAARVDGPLTATMYIDCSELR